MPWDALYLIQLDIIGAYQLGASWGAWAQVKDLSSRPYAARELMLIKVRCGAPQRRELSDLADIFHGTVCDVSLTTITLELQGKEDKMHALQGLLEPYGQTLPDIQSNPPSDSDTISCAGWFERLLRQVVDAYPQGVCCVHIPRVHWCSLHLLTAAQPSFKGLYMGMATHHMQTKCLNVPLMPGRTGA